MGGAAGPRALTHQACNLRDGGRFGAALTNGRRRAVLGTEVQTLMTQILSFSTLANALINEPRAERWLPPLLARARLGY